MAAESRAIGLHIEGSSARAWIGPLAAIVAVASAAVLESAPSGSPVTVVAVAAFFATVLAVAGARRGMQARNAAAPP